MKWVEAEEQQRQAVMMVVGFTHQSPHNSYTRNTAMLG
jgi:hypothetical protein